MNTGVFNITDWIQIIGIIVAALVPVIIMFVTLRSEKKRHVEQVKEIQEKNRIDAMPVLDLQSAMVTTWEEKEDRIIFTAIIALKNTGNGTAVNVHAKESDVLVNIPKGELESIGTIRLEKRLDEILELEVVFNDLYGNMYSETLHLELQKIESFYELTRIKIATKKLEN